MSLPAAPASDSPSDIVQGYWLLGLDSASFEPSGIEQLETHALRQDGGPCQDTSPTSVPSVMRQRALHHLAIRVNQTGNPFLLFTHIPDLQDPFPDRQVKLTPEKKLVCRYTSSWFLSPESQKIWNGILSNQKLVGVFAGHWIGFTLTDSAHLFPLGILKHG